MTKKLTKNQEKEFEKLFLTQNCLKQIMSQKIERKKIEKLFSGMNNEPKKLQKSKKNREKLFLAQNCLKRISRWVETAVDWILQYYRDG